MRPLKLVMSAFGPYAKEETLDFTTLNDKNIFLITGPTGAGKTTIFDALSVALYGEASGSSRDKDSLRSDFAEDGISTYVELSFMLRGKNYTIKRYPQQMKKKARGEGYVQKSAEAELLLPEGKILTGVKSVDEKVAEILGITSQQFKQIVMLPQGEFRKLLEAESVEREKIFRKIFGTETFLQVQKNLEEKERELYRAISKVASERAVYIRSIDAGDDAVLFTLKEAEDKNIKEILELTKDKISKDEEERTNLNKVLENIRKEQEELQIKLTRALEINKKIRYTEELKETLNKEVTKETYYLGETKELNLSRKAFEIVPIEEQTVQKEINKNNKEKELFEAQKDFDEKIKILEESTKLLEIETKKEYLRKQVTENIARLKDFEPRVREYEKKKADLTGLINKKSDIEKKKNDNKNIINNTKKELEEIEINLNVIQKNELLKAKKEQELLKVSDNIELLVELYSKCNKYSTKTIEYKKEFAEFSKLKKDFEACNKLYIDTYDRFIRGQAGILAEELKESEPCPVCGSLEHPKRAEKLQETPSADEVDKKKLEVNEAEKKCTDKANKVSAIKAALEELKNIFNDIYVKASNLLDKSFNSLEIEKKLIVIKDTGVDLRKIQTNIVKEISEINKIIDNKLKLQERREFLIVQTKKKEQNQEVLEKEFTELYGIVKSENELLLSIEKEIPDEKRSLSSLSKEIEESKNNLNLLQEGYRLAQEKFNEVSSLKALSEGDLRVKEKNLKESILEFEESKNKFKASISEHGFKDYFEYSSLKRSKEEIETLEITIKKYNENLKSLKDRVIEIEKETCGLEVISTEKLQEEICQSKAREKTTNEEDNKLFARIDNNKKQLQNINKLTSIIAKGEDEYGIIADLAKMAKGDNSEKISFERYVLAAYFNEIINAANIRLMKMTGRRFMLKRKEDRVKGNKQSGLELEVFDNYTGKARHVKTLSGGEGFKASLSLALGLADVVQSYAGGIRVDTMFIDEGFGSLDQESLDNAINCLIDLQQGGRLVGIISHVSELKERIDTRLEVTPAKEGSRAKFNI